MIKNKINWMQYKFTSILILFFIFLVTPTVNCQSKTDDGKNHNPSDPFLNSSTAEEQGIDSELLADMLQKIKEENLKIRSVIIIKNGKLVLESYVHPYNKDVMHDVKSVSKSIISSIVGIALKEKIIESINQKIVDFLPEYFPKEADPQKKEINLAHLLSMSTGLEIDENGPVMNDIMSKEDWIKETFKRPLTSAPGDQFSYCTFLTHTISIILTKSSGTGLMDMGNKYLFEPLGIKQVHWGKGPQGYYFGGDKLWLTPRAMAKFGYLYLNKGKWGDNQIFPEEWVVESTKNQFDEFPDSSYAGYGYWWWLGKNGSYLARGAGGQIISVYPDRDMVVVFTGADNSIWHNLTNDYIMPAINMVDSLPPNPIAENRIKTITRDLKLPEFQSPKPLPERAHKISGKKYLLQKNDMEFSEFTFWFNDPKRCRLIIKYNGVNMDLAIGLDEVYRVSEKVKWGIKSENNTLALRGRWVNKNKFTIDFQEVGEPLYFDVELEFDDENVSASFIWQPFGWEFLLEGIAEQ
jgi:CubicO group peptidase (beta-lactamase class C family)